MAKSTTFTQAALSAAIGLSLCSVSLAVAAGKKPPCRLVTPCPCPEITAEPEQIIVTPKEPQTQPVPPGEVPSQPPAQPPQTADALDQALTSGYDVAASSDIVSPNMFGDQFGGGGSSFAVQLPPMPMTLVSLPGANLDLILSPLTVTAPPNALVISSPIGTGSPVPAPAAFPATVGSGPAFILSNDPTFSSVAAVVVQQGLGLPGTLQNFAGFADGDSPSSPPDFLVGRYDYAFDPLVIFIANPADGGIVGRTKIADDNNPLPRDRFIFNYDYFSNVPLTANGWNVSRFSPGFEKTFFNRMTSVEVRFPFASTLDSVVTQGQETTNTEFGDIHLTFKALLFGSRVWNVAGGLGMSLPTSDDVNVTIPTIDASVKVDNQAVLLQPYLAALWTPNNRFFAQGWLQFNFDANGNPVTTTSNGRVTNIGRINAQSLLSLDGQIGYWIVQRPDADGFRLAGLAPFLELHYNTTLNDPDVMQFQNLTVASLGGRIDELNLSAGLVSQIGNNLNVALGAVVPLKSGYDRFFDAQVGLRASYFFGPTARARSLATRVSNF